MGIHPTSVHSVFLTHFHPDHIADLIPLLFTRNYTAELYEKKLTIYGPTGLVHFLRTMAAAYGEWLNDIVDQSVEVIELKEGIFELDRLILRILSVNHAPESIGYRFESAAGTIAFTGDTGYSLNAAKLCRDADIAVMECAAMQRGGNHLCPEEVAEMALLSQPAQLLINHCYPEVVTTDPVVRINAIYSGKVMRAYDGQVLSCNGVSDAG